MTMRRRIIHHAAMRYAITVRSVCDRRSREGNIVRQLKQDKKRLLEENSMVLIIHSDSKMPLC